MGRHCARAWPNAASPRSSATVSVRDVAGVLSTGLPVWAAGVAAPPSVAGLTFVDWQQPIGCGGVAIFRTSDRGRSGWRRRDSCGMVDEVTALAIEQERLEGWIMTEVNRGVPLPGLYPANAETRARYEAWKKRARPA